MIIVLFASSRVDVLSSCRNPAKRAATLHYISALYCAKKIHVCLA